MGKFMFILSPLVTFLWHSKKERKKRNRHFFLPFSHPLSTSVSHNPTQSVSTRLLSLSLSLPLWIVYPVSLLLHHSFTAPSSLPSHSNLLVWKVFPEKGMWEDRREWWIAPWMLHFVLSPRTGWGRGEGIGGFGWGVWQWECWGGRKGMRSFGSRTEGGQRVTAGPTYCSDN